MIHSFLLLTSILVAGELNLRLPDQNGTDCTDPPVYKSAEYLEIDSMCKSRGIYKEKADSIIKNYIPVIIQLLNDSCNILKSDDSTRITFFYQGHKIF